MKQLLILFVSVISALAIAGQKAVTDKGDIVIYISFQLQHLLVIEE